MMNMLWGGLMGSVVVLKPQVPGAWFDFLSVQSFTYSHHAFMCSSFVPLPKKKHAGELVTLNCPSCKCTACVLPFYNLLSWYHLVLSALKIFRCCWDQQVLVCDHFCPNIHLAISAVHFLAVHVLHVSYVCVYNETNSYHLSSWSMHASLHRLELALEVSSQQQRLMQDLASLCTSVFNNIITKMIISLFSMFVILKLFHNIGNTNGCCIFVVFLKERSLKTHTHRFHPLRPMPELLQQQMVKASIGIKTSQE